MRRLVPQGGSVPSGHEHPALNILMLSLAAWWCVGESGVLMLMLCLVWWRGAPEPGDAD